MSFIRWRIREVHALATRQKKSLVLVRTPFQAWLVEKVLKAEEVTSFDLLYFTQNDSREDQVYYQRLAEKSRNAKYIHVPRQVVDILNHVRFSLASWAFVYRKSYGATLLASVDSYAINAIANRRQAGEIVTFDDGTANYNQAGLYFRDVHNWRERFYLRAFGAKTIQDTRMNIVRHYTIHPALENIVDRTRLRSVPGWESFSRERSQGNKKVFFIGAPFRETLNHIQIENLEAYAREIGVDVYVRHPREDKPLNLDAPFLEKKGRIAEEAILNDAGGQQIVLVGFLSSVMFNLASCAYHRIVLVPTGSQRYTFLIKLAQEAGCEIVNLSDR
ncbi:glycosyltransferase family 52 [Halomonas sp. H10-9-1]|uniref:glycosyltransferase family 52 n=1 Tax=Halomonas sp. H10-9-1 TaxID=2950871 RepID=UPI0032E0077B